MRFFDKNDKRCLIDLHGRKAKFQIKDTFLGGWSANIHDICECIWLEIEKRNFDIPGLDPQFLIRIDEGAVEMMSIRYGDVRISSDEIMIKDKRVSIHSDGSGSMDFFVGDPNDETDVRRFRNGALVNSKLRKEKKIHLHYDFNLYYSGNVFLSPDDVMSDESIGFKVSNDLGRLYDPEGDEPTFFTLKQVSLEIADKLRALLAEIRSFPVPEKIDFFAEPVHIPLTNPLYDDQPLYGFIDDRYRNEESVTLKPNKRLLNLGVKLPEHPDKEIMHDGFVYLERQFADRPVETSKYNYGMMFGGGVTVVEVRLKNANGVYVIDACTFEEHREKYFEEFKAKNPDWEKSEDAEIRYPKLTDEQVNSYEILEALTMVPINDYRGEYKKPIVIVNRNIWDDEITVVSNKTAEEFRQEWLKKNKKKTA